MSLTELIRLIIKLLLKPYVFIPLVFPGLITVMIILLLTIWIERKIAAKVQLRYGPLNVTRKLGGVLQLVADLLRYLFAEPITPEKTDKLAFLFSPLLLFGSAFIPVVLIPLSSEYYAVNSEISLLIVLALITIPPIFDLLIGWSSNNKYSLIGGLREGYLVISHEIPLLMSTLSMAILYGSFNLIDIIEKQHGVKIGLILNPLAAIVYILSSYMATSRFPFEIAEAETEIVMGPYTEYSGILYGLTMGASYVKLYILSLVFAIIFLGGWKPIWLASFNPIISGIILVGKSLIIVAIGIFLRAVYPRYRIDQAIKIGWKILTPLAVVSILLSLGLIAGGVV